MTEDRAADSSDDETLGFLASLPLFATLSQDVLRRIVEIAVPRSFAAGDVVFREGDRGDSCYVVRTGRARAIRENSAGRTITLATFGPGDMFGELAMFEDEPRSATVEVTRAATLIAILRADMHRLMRTHHQLTIGLIVAQGRRLRATNERLFRQSFQGIRSRVANVLRELVALAQREGAPDTGVLLIVTQTDLANLAGCSRESVNRVLAALAHDGVIAKGRGKLTVRRPQALARYIF